MQDCNSSREMGTIRSFSPICSIDGNREVYFKTFLDLDINNRTNMCKTHSRIFFLLQLSTVLSQTNPGVRMTAKAEGLGDEWKDMSITVQPATLSHRYRRRWRTQTVKKRQLDQKLEHLDTTCRHLWVDTSPGPADILVKFSCKRCLNKILDV